MLFKAPDNLLHEDVASFLSAGTFVKIYSLIKFRFISKIDYIKIMRGGVSGCLNVFSEITSSTEDGATFLLVLSL